MDLRSPTDRDAMIQTNPGSPTLHGPIDTLKTSQTSNTPYINQEESAIDIEHEKQIVKIDYQKMKEQITSLHAQKTDGETYNLKDALYKLKVGHHRLLSSSANSDLDKFGIGITLYFRFLKHLGLFFLIFMLLSIPAYIFYIAAYVQYYDSSSTPSYLNVLTSTTIGSIGMGSKACTLGRHPDYGTTDEAMFHLSCIKGNIADVSNINFGFVQLGSQCDYILQDDITTECNQYDYSKLQSAFSSCDGKPDCEVSISQDLFVLATTNSYCNEIYAKKMVYMQVTCISRSVEVSGDDPVLKSKIAYVVTTLDAIIVLVFLSMILSLKYAQRSAVKHVLQHTYSASSYSLMITNLPQKSSHQETCAEIWEMLKNKLDQDTEEAKNHIIDVQVVPPYKLIEYIGLLEQVKITKREYIRNFIEHYAPESNNLQHLNSCDLDDIMSNLKESKHPKYNKAQKDFNTIVKLSTQQKKLKAAIHRLESAPSSNLDVAFVTCNDIQTRNRILNAFAAPSQLERFFNPSLKKLSHQNDIAAQPTDEPDAIIWENLGAPKRTVFFRRSLSLICALLLWAISSTIIIVSTYYQNDLNNQYPSINCEDKDPTKTQASFDYNLGDYQAGLIVCYCSADISSRKNEIFDEVNDETLCLTWYKNEIALQVISWVIVFVIIVMNYLVKVVFLALSHFEKHTSKSKRLSEKSIKTFIGQFLNTGLIILFTNIKSSISWWQGQYNDLSPLWYSEVGSTLVSTLLINAASGPSAQIAQVFFKKLLQWIDRKFKNDEAITRKKKQSDYEKVYTGPVFSLDSRYSQILTVVFVCFFYGSGMPILYFTTFFQLAFTYFVDKYYLLKFCKVPDPSSHNLETIIRRTLYAAVVLHLLIAIFVFGESSLFVDGISVVSTSSTVDSIETNAASNSENVVRKFFNRAGYKYNIIFVVILMITFGLLIVKAAIYILQKFKIRQNPKNKIFTIHIREKNHSDGPSFLQLLKASELDILINMTQRDINGTQDIKLLPYLQDKLQTLQKAYLQKKDENNQGNCHKLTGFFSYDFRLNINKISEEEAAIRKIMAKFI